MGLSFYNYCNNAPKHNAIWNMILYYLDTSSFSALDAIKEIARKHEIGEQK